MTAARLFVYRFRRPLAAASAALAALILVASLRPGEAPGIDIVIAAHDLPAGAQLTADDLDRASLPLDYAPPGALSDPSLAVGRTIAADMLAGEVVTATRLVTAEGTPQGMSVVPVRLADAEAADLLAPGSVVDLVAIEGAEAGRIIAEAVRVVTVPRAETASGLSGTQRRAGSLIVVATDRRTAVLLASVGAQPGLGVVMR